ncbi:hypothetical protein QFZ82_005511 [Streptomyces sp. V4I23]|uniref:hypothetical protein n=1 Tax=Streptomyces sp. V4I23 TaxID=3042282 RepID=UPI00278A69E8|nr:hypothetical protein [Streptomyces sp. V4I23]MDQ1011026.1 hypothetical protein [Streptomyces sp. V4I23]
MLNSGGHSALLRTALAGALLVAGLAVASSGGDNAKADTNGKVTVVYDNAVKPKDRQAVAVVRKSACSSSSPTG